MPKPGFLFTLLAGLLAVFAAGDLPGEDYTSRHVAAGVDRIIGESLKAENAELAPVVSDEEFLRRVSLDLAGRTPSPEDLALFSLDPAAAKRSAVA